MKSNDGYVRWATRLYVRRWDHTMSTYTWKDSGNSSIRMPRLVVRTQIVFPQNTNRGSFLKLPAWWALWMFSFTISIRVYWILKLIPSYWRCRMADTVQQFLAKMDSWKRIFFACKPAVKYCTVGQSFFYQIQAICVSFCEKCISHVGMWQFPDSSWLHYVFETSSIQDVTRTNECLSYSGPQVTSN